MRKQTIKVVFAGSSESSLRRMFGRATEPFDALKRTPEFFRRYLQRYLAYAELGSRAALDDTLEHVFNDSGYRAIWARLLPSDRAVLRALAKGVNDLHSLPARRRLGEDLGLDKAASLDAPRNALLRLQKDELVTKVEYGRYQIQDEAFVDWLRQIELDE